jgi:hypothetical protein
MWAVFDRLTIMLQMRPIYQLRNSRDYGYQEWVLSFLPMGTDSWYPFYYVNITAGIWVQ